MLRPVRSTLNVIAMLSLPLWVIPAMVYTVIVDWDDQRSQWPALLTGKRWFWQ